MNAFDPAAIAVEAMSRASTLPDRKRPLHRELPPPPPFPGAILGNLRHAAEAMHETVRAPFAMCAQSALAAATLAIQAHRDVELPCGVRPLVGLFATVADSGERKTSLDRIATRAVRAIEQRWSEQSLHDRAAFNADLEAWKEAGAVAKRNGKGDRAAIRNALIAIGPEPSPPRHPMLLVADPTPEALVLHLEEARPWGGVFTSEGGLLIGGSAFNDETRMRTGALFNTLWDGEPIRRRRVLTGSHYLPGRRCSAHVMMQPVVASRLFGDAEMNGIGLIARFLVVAPESTAGTRLWREPAPGCGAALGEYDARLTSWLDRAPRTTDAGALDPEPVTLHPDARRMWLAFHDHVETAMRPGAGLETIRAFASKMPEHAGRLAAVIALYDAPDAMEVGAEPMAAGITLAQHYAAEMLRLAGAAAVSPDLHLADRLLTWWQARPDPKVHLAAIYQRGLNALGDAATARRVVAILEDHGWITRLPPGAQIEGAPRRDGWELTL